MLPKDHVAYISQPSPCPQLTTLPLLHSAAYDSSFGKTFTTRQVASFESTLLVSAPSAPPRNSQPNSMTAYRPQPSPQPAARSILPPALDKASRPKKSLLPDPQDTTAPLLHSATCEREFETTVVMLQAASFAATLLVSPPSAPIHNTMHSHLSQGTKIGGGGYVCGRPSS